MGKFFEFKTSIIFLSLFFACNSEKNNITEQASSEVHALKIEEIHAPAIDSLLDSALLDGVILVYDESNNQLISNNFDKATEQVLPASTFKIPNTIIGLETDKIESEQTIFKWDGEERAMSVWEQDLVLRDAFQFSCVPCYQSLALRIGLDTMHHYLDKLQFGEMIVTQSTLDNFWLTGPSKISPYEHVEFIRKLFHVELPIKKRTQNIMKNILSIDHSAEYHLSGKTGWANLPNKDIGWFVGYLEKDNNNYFFATKVEPKENFDMKDFPRIRMELTVAILEELVLTI